MRLAPAIGLTALLVLALAGTAMAAQSTVGLGTAGTYAVLAGTTVTNTGPSSISGSVGVSPGSATTGFPPGIVTNGTIHAADAAAALAQADLTTAYNDAAGRATTVTVSADLAGQTLVSGVYAGGALGLTGTVTLDAQGDPNAVFIFKAASTLTTAPGSTVALVNGAQACNVFWQIGSSATVGTTTAFKGSILALTSIALNTGASLQGRALARNGAVTLDNNVITVATCSSTAPAPSASPSATASPTATPLVIAPAPTVPPTDTASEANSANSRAILPLALGILALVAIAFSGSAPRAAVRTRPRD